MKKLKVSKTNLGDVGASFLMKCLFNVREVHAKECGISPKMSKKLRKHARVEGCKIYCE